MRYRKFHYQLHLRAFTLIELLIALSITAAIGMCIALMINAVSQGTMGQQDGRRHLVRMQALEAHLVNNLHNASCILAAGNGYVVYWTGDSNSDNIMQLSELGMLELNTTTNTLNEYKTVFPGTFTLADRASADTKYAASTSWYAAAQTAKSTGYFVGTPIARNVSSFSVSLDNATATAATLATIKFKLSDTQVTRCGMVSAAIRNVQAPQ